jgi:hypothetical protein
MDRVAAETYLRRVAEDELRHAMTLAAGGAVNQWHSPRLALAAQVLRAVGAVDDRTAWQIQGEHQLALATRQLGRPGLSPAARHHLNVALQVERARAGARLSPGSGYPAARSAAWRVVPVGRVIPGDGRHDELLLLAYVQTPAGAKFAVEGGMATSHGRVRAGRQLAATDDRGTSYRLRSVLGSGTGLLELMPQPAHAIGWLDVSAAPGEPGIRVGLDQPVPAPEVSVTRSAPGPGELMLDVVATRILTSTADFPPDDPGYLASAGTDLRAFVGNSPGEIVAALRAAGALTPDSRLPGQLAGLLGRLGIDGHGIAAPPDAGLPPRWQSMLTRYHRRGPYPVPAPGSWAAAVAELPELDGVRIAVLGLHQGERETILHLLASGVMAGEDDWEYMRGVRPLPALWVRDSGDRWHATHTSGLSAADDYSEVMLWLAIVPPLERGTARIDVVATGASAEIRVGLPLRWR